MPPIARSLLPVIWSGAMSLQSARQLLVGLLFAAALHGEVKALRNFTLIDGTGKPPARASAMLVENGRVTWVGPAAQLKLPAGAEVIDLTGKFVMPGIINLHGHLGNSVDLVQEAKFYTPDSVRKNLATYASYGVTTVLSLGTDQDAIFKIRDEQRAGRPSITRVFTAGQGLLVTGGYGGLAGVTPGVATPAEADAAVEAQAKKHVDIVKLWMDDHLGTQRRCPTMLPKPSSTAPTSGVFALPPTSFTWQTPNASSSTVWTDWRTASGIKMWTPL